MKNKKFFRIFETDDYGKEVRCLGAFAVKDGEDPKEVAANFLHMPDIKKTGFYAAKETTIQEMNEDKLRLYEEMQLRNKILN